jgi:transposase
LLTLKAIYKLQLLKSMNYNYFIGIDVSKKTLDFAVVKMNETAFHMKVDNNLTGIQEFIKRIKKEKDFCFTTSMFCMEHTGIYNNHLLKFFQKQTTNVSLVAGIEIKQSSGLKRGKNDKVDAIRIAAYAYKNREDLKLWQPKREVVEELKHLAVLRSRLINVQKQLKTSLKESINYIEKKFQKQAEILCKSTINSVKKDIDKVNDKIQNVIKADEELNRLFNIITSVGGIGLVTATEVIITTNEFKDITCAKKFACYSGVAPFEHRSGTSIRGKNRVSQMGNKCVKTLLHMSALAAIVYNEELKNYYERKVKEGKNKMSIINAVRNKLIHRIFACVKQNREYQKNYSYSLV